MAHVLLPTANLAWKLPLMAVGSAQVAAPVACSVRSAETTRLGYATATADRESVATATTAAVARPRASAGEAY